MELNTGEPHRIQSAYMLNGNEVRPNEWYVVHLAEHTHNSTVVNARNQNGKEIVEEERVFLEIEG